ncbi:hypothetical protein IU501_09580 [Nocardia otitidiscaviarum]|uniref:hypothetical protein n=1 Tax=Nocardia otitidiscaviarum TaxID=1823 RepID=UPI0004A783E5|nr:hypothetical protein [Nocardia otitidiscaviarum]MBF6133247.1 hypothetical protein [Nocardia otitidiscaviarum]MBF6486643.1 hypothetical protein [Nocardia otitidiscaviarum]
MISMEIFAALTAVIALGIGVFSALDADNGHPRRATVTLTAALAVGATALCVLAPADIRAGVIVGTLVILITQLAPKNSPYRVPRG